MKLKITNKLLPLRKRKKELLVLAICRNCNTQLEGRYCHYCGQDLFSGAKRSVGDLLINTLENMFVLDNKLFVTLKYLIFVPGKLTMEYIHGRMVSYVHPAKLFWFITILFFTLLTTSFSYDSKDNKPKETVQDTTITTSQPTIVNNEKSDTDKEGQLNLKELINSLSSYAPYVIFLLIPFFAFLMFLFFKKKDFFYVDHFAFALHFHAFIFLLYGLYIGMYKLWPTFQFHKTVFLLIPTAYFLRAIWVVYHPTKGALITKASVIMVIYFFAVVTVTVSFIALTAWIIYGNKILD